MLVAEAASNSIEHAYTARSGGALDGSLLPAGDGKQRLVVEDDGAGFGPGDAGPRHSLGTPIKRGLAERPGGTLRLGE